MENKEDENTNPPEENKTLSALRLYLGSTPFSKDDSVSKITDLIEKLYTSDTGYAIDESIDPLSLITPRNDGFIPLDMDSFSSYPPIVNLSEESPKKSLHSVLMEKLEKAMNKLEELAETQPEHVKLEIKALIDEIINAPLE